MCTSRRSHLRSERKKHCLREGEEHLAKGVLLARDAVEDDHEHETDEKEQNEHADVRAAALCTHNDRSARTTTVSASLVGSAAGGIPTHLPPKSLKPSLHSPHSDDVARLGPQQETTGRDAFA
jgi:hypothetical protein